ATDGGGAEPASSLAAQATAARWLRTTTSSRHATTHVPRTRPRSSARASRSSIGLNHGGEYDSVTDFCRPGHYWYNDALCNDGDRSQCSSPSTATCVPLV